MNLLRLVLYGIIGYLLGYSIGKCIQGHAQAEMNEVVHLNTGNTVVLRGVIEELSVLDTQLRIAKLVALRGIRTYPIYLVLDSPGGGVDAGIQLIEFTKVIPNIRTITIFAASMAAITVELLPGSRLITNNGTLMFHRAAAQISGQVEVGELETRMASLKALILGLEERIASRLKIPVSEYKVKVKDEMWLSSKESIKEKAADKIVDISCSEDLVDQRIKGFMMSIFGASVSTFSGCPTLRSPVEEPKEEKLAI